jgi:hypothetical protein
MLLPESWEQANSGSRRSKQWRERGFGFELLVAILGGRKMKRPLAKYHGAQIMNLFRSLQKLWNHAELRKGIEALEEDDEVKHVVQVSCLPRCS